MAKWSVNQPEFNAQATRNTSMPQPSDVVVNQFSDPKGLGKVAVGAGCIGAVAGAHAILLASTTSFRVVRWSTFALLMSLFHALEFLLTALYHPDTVSFDSMLLNHSHEYIIAAVAAATEFWLEAWLVPSAWSVYRYDFCVGLVLVAVGQLFRSLAMWTATRSFTHTIAQTKENGHQLVTWGVYRLMRHPSYCGWFWWSIGMQIVLGNPLTTIAAVFASWSFFNERIPYEEYLLEQFFGEKYRSYRQKTPSGIPFVK